MTYDELGSVLEKAKQNWIDGICITGGEPTLQRDLIDTVSFIKSKGMDLKIDTQGTFPETLRKVMASCDYIAMDYKMPLDKYSFIANTEVDKDKIKQSLNLLKNGQVDYEMRTTIIPGIHTEDDIRKICTELHGVKRFALQTFIPRDNLPDAELRNTEKTPTRMIEHYADICRGYFDDVIVR